MDIREEAIKVADEVDKTAYWGKSEPIARFAYKAIADATADLQAQKAQVEKIRDEQAGEMVRLQGALAKSETSLGELRDAQRFCHANHLTKDQVEQLKASHEAELKVAVEDAVERCNDVQEAALKKALAAERLRGEQAVAKLQERLDVANRQYREAESAWKKREGELRSEAEAKHQAAWDDWLSDFDTEKKVWKEKVQQEKLRGEQAVKEALQAAQSEFIETHKDVTEQAVEMERRNWEAYRAGEQERIAKAVAEAWEKAALVAEEHRCGTPAGRLIAREIREDYESRVACGQLAKAPVTEAKIIAMAKEAFEGLAREEKAQKPKRHFLATFEFDTTWCTDGAPDFVPAIVEA